MNHPSRREFWHFDNHEKSLLQLFHSIDRLNYKLAKKYKNLSYNDNHEVNERRKTRQ